VLGWALDRVADFIIKTGDMIQITVPPPAVVPQLVAPVPLMGTGTTLLINKQPVCLQGDELPMAISGPLMYTAPPFVTPGVGTLTIMLVPTNLTATTTTSHKSALLKGSSFQAMFNVSSPAMQPTPAGPVPDPVVVKTCQAQFITSTVNAKAG
jgi:hypothetical protein